MTERRHSPMALEVSSEPPLTLDIRSFHRVRFAASAVAFVSFTLLAVAWKWNPAWVVTAVAAVTLVHATLRIRVQKALWGTLLLDTVVVCVALAAFRPPTVAAVSAIVHVVTAPIFLTSGRVTPRLVFAALAGTSLATAATVFWPPTIEWTPLRTVLVTAAILAIFVPLMLWMIRRTAEQSRDRERIRKDLEASRRRLQDILDNAPVGMELTGIGPSKFVAVNSAFADFVGYTTDELLDLTVPDVVHPEDLADTRWAADALVAGELDMFHAERRYIRKDGQVVWASFSLSVVRDDDGIPAYAIGQVSDITRRKAAESERDLLLELSLGVAEAGSTEEAMQSVLAGLGAAGGWSIGVLWVPSAGGLARVSTWAAHPGVDKWTDTTSRLEWGEGLVGETALRRQPLAVPSLASDPHFLGKAEAARLGLDAALAVPVLAGADLVGVLLFLGVAGVDPKQELNTIEAVVAQLGQVIAARLAEEERGRLAAVLEHTTDIAGFSDREGNVRYLNPAARKLLGINPDEDVTRLHVGDLHPPEVAQFILTTVVPKVVRSGTWRGETAFLARDGRVIPTSQVVVAHRDASGKVTYLSTIARDITTQKLLEAQQEELIRSKDEFIASVSHEIRTPLTAVRGFAEILADPHDSLDESERHEMVRWIASEAADVSDIVEDLLVAARSDIDQVSVSLRPVDLGSVVSETVSRLRLDGKSVSVEIPDALRVNADPLRLRQILRNLIVNAVRYGGQEVRLVACQEGSEVAFEVRDNGGGIEAGMHEEIFAPYRRGHDRAGLPGSVGLGLSVSRRLARLMGGDVSYSVVDSWPTFTLRLPAS
ncbi:MAG: PAS domain S-box protein [Acidimicrobiia bacterium]